MPDWSVIIENQSPNQISIIVGTSRGPSCEDQKFVLGMHHGRGRIPLRRVLFIFALINSMHHRSHLHASSFSLSHFHAHKKRANNRECSDRYCINCICVVLISLHFINLIKISLPPDSSPVRMQSESFSASPCPRCKLLF